jgi:hypothetical protein
MKKRRASGRVSFREYLEYKVETEPHFQDWQFAEIGGRQDRATLLPGAAMGSFAGDKSLKWEMKKKMQALRAFLEE